MEEAQRMDDREKAASNSRQTQRPKPVSKEDLYAVLEDLLPFAEEEVGAMNDVLDEFPEQAERVLRGEQAIDAAKRMIARRRIIDPADREQRAERMRNYWRKKRGEE
jgi:hypothetical protein